MIPRGTPTPAPIAVLLLLACGLDEGVEVVVLCCVCVTELGRLLNVLLLDVDAGGDMFAVMGDVFDVVREVISDVVVSDKDVARDAISAIDNAARELMTGARMVPLPVPQLQVSSSSQQN